MKVYLAAPLFSLGEKEFNGRLALALRHRGVDVLLPQEFSEAIERDEDFFRRAFEACIAGIDEASIVLAVLDGADADSGTCFEVGYAYAKQVPVIGIRTDFRDSEERGVNLMLAESATEFLRSSSISMDQLADAILARITAVGARDERSDNAE